MTNRMTVTPAYGREYKTQKSAKADWDADMDFIVADLHNPYDGKPINLTQAREVGLDEVTLRFDSLRKIAVVKVVR